MEARGRDVELLRTAGLECGGDGGRVVLKGPLLAPLPRLEWSGWDSLSVSITAGAEALASTAAALPSLRRLMVTYFCSTSGSKEAILAAVAAVLRRYPVEEFLFDVRSFLGWRAAPGACAAADGGQTNGTTACEAGVEMVAEATAAWLARPCATSLTWYIDKSVPEEIFSSGVAASAGLQQLRLQIIGRIRAAPILAALEGLPRLEEVTLNAWGGVEEEELCLRLAHMPALRSCSMVGLGRGGLRLSLEVDLESLPALEVLDVEEGGVGEVAG